MQELQDCIESASASFLLRRVSEGPDGKADDAFPQWVEYEGKNGVMMDSVTNHCGRKALLPAIGLNW